MRSLLIKIFAQTSVLLSVACSPVELPQKLTVIGEEEWQMDVLYDVRDNWCDATGWCPEFVSHGGNQVIFTEDYPQKKIDEFKPAFHKSGVIRFNKNHWQINNFDWLWTIAAHEFGHLGTQRAHSNDPDSVMNKGVYEPAPACLDNSAVDLFCDKSEQCIRRDSTCNQP